MNKAPVIAGNWKMNLNPQEVRGFFQAFAPQVVGRCQPGNPGIPSVRFIGCGVGGPPVLTFRGCGSAEHSLGTGRGLHRGGLRASGRSLRSHTHPHRTFGAAARVRGNRRRRWL